MATAPYCNVTVASPSGQPVSPKGFQPIPPNATLAQVISILNNNFAPSTQDQVFKQQLAANFKTISNAIKDGLSKLRFVQKTIERKKVRVENPDDSSQFIMDDRVKNLTMSDQATGAQWTFADDQV